MSAPAARFLTGSTMGHVVRMTLTGSVGVTFLFLVDAANLFWVSLLGVERFVAALGFAWTIQFFTVSFGIGIMIASTATVSRLIGQGNRADARCQTTVCALSAFGIQALVAIIILFFRRDILSFAGAEGQTLEDAARYLLISVPSLPIMALGMVGSAVLRAEGDAWRAMMVTLSAGAISMIIDPILIFTFELGLDGAAIAVGFSRLLSAIISILFVVRVHDLAGRVTVADFKRLALPFAVVAVPAILTQLSTPFGNYIVTAVIAGFGDGAVAGWAVVSRLTVLAFGGLFALSGAIGGIFGQNYGAGYYDRVERTYRDALVFCGVYTLLAWSILAYLSDFIINVFNLGADANAVILAFTTWAAGAWLFTGAIFVANASFNSLGRPIFSTLLNWSRDGVLLLPLALLFGGWFGAKGAVYGHAVSGVIVGSIAAISGWLFVRFLRRVHAQQTSTFHE